ncbi:hypothetical protein N7471_010616 [Penicillium samsonianum]|uniref:uncharacterized protein n=1 Tax=Penicillium samsonianum TaxID=1882272 RepID=UPI0025475EE6|nr:uncharacterized protein N7471_010616 [Penicillium samsonianum]KAJ6126123.1 hypothetical protein N7471_010616 [Penicillium samsonianum]
MFSSSNDPEFQTPGALPVDSCGYPVNVLETRSHQDKHKGRYGSRGTGNHQDGNTTYNTAQPCQKRKKRRSSIRPLSDPSESFVPISSHCSGAIQGVRGSAILTVESNTGLKPAYFFTFVPDPGPMLSRPNTAVISGKPRRYTSDENALLVRLKEKEAMSWPEITTHFPGRNMSSLQVHYSTKLRRKASSQSRKTRRRE